ncbi:MAG TPA: lamin tail domain-containing protein, partial [Cyclobacteriaceae bacterium]|nr:lamin tail domain-containing protein [Cyclobacteriaceae bacterium]
MIRTTIRLLSSAFFLHAHLCLAQFTDNFSDGDFTNNPSWSGTADFIINASSQLQLNNSVAGTSRLSSSFEAPSLDNFEWQVNVRQTFSSSGSNYGRVYLVSDQTNLSGPLNGYYLQFGEAGALDAIELFRQSGLVSTSVCRATNGTIANSFNVRVRVLRSNTGLWKLMVDNTGGTNFVQEASGTDATFNSSSALGVVCVYTASNANKFFYDDFFMGPEIVDLAPPTIVSVTPFSSTGLDVVFNEKVDAVSAQLLSNYSINNAIGNPTSATLQTDEKTVRLSFSQQFPNAQTCQVSIVGVKDLFNNAMALTNSNFLFFQPVSALANDIILTEIFADPSPTVGLPELEFVEIYNRSNKIFDIQNWTITDGSSTGTLPSHLFFPNEYIILTSVSAASQFASYGTVLGISNFPTLNNSGDQLRLFDNAGLEIDNVSYTIDWYGDDDKNQGGYTLELINPSDTCTVENNWTASISISGGTPGIQNSAFSDQPDLAGPKLISAIPTSATEILIRFNEKLQEQLPGVTDFSISPAISVLQISFTDDALKELHLTLSAAIQSGIIYTISVQNTYDCPGNLVDDANDTFVFGLPEAADHRDVIINEILANPSPSIGLPAVEFIEIYNRSDKILDLKNWKITDGSATGSLPQHLFFPNEYIILTSTSAEAQFSSYGVVLGVTNFPSLNNSGETLFLKDPNDIEINKVSFTDGWYRDDDEKNGGYSLERIDPDNICAEDTNWAASEALSGGTPGIQNSVFSDQPDLVGPKLISSIPASATEIIIQFNEKLQEQLPAVTDFSITPSTPVSDILFTDETLKTFKLTLSAELQTRVIYTITAQNIYDCPGNVVDENSNSFVFGLSEGVDHEDVIINEIFANPSPSV